MIVDELKDSILESAIRGTLVYNSKDNARELLQKMIEKNELSNMSVTELVKLADITRSTFYTHYDSIYDVASNNCCKYN